MIIITSEYTYYNNKLDETCNFVENTLLEHEQKYCADYLRSVKVKCFAEFLDKTENEIKIKTIHSCKNNEELNKVMQSSEGMVILVRINKLRIVKKRIVF